MSVKEFIAKRFARYIHNKNNKEHSQAPALQESTLLYLIGKAKNTQFGKDHSFHTITTYEEYKKNVPVRDYEALSGYIHKVVDGAENILWIGKPLYFAKTSGTTSGTKYIPISNESISHHINSARNALLEYVYHSGDASFLSGKVIFLSGSPVLETKNGILTGRLSGISNHHVPAYLKKNQMPSYATNCIEDWEQKVDTIAQETLHQDMRLISGIPPWVQMYFDKLQEKSGKKIGDLYPNFKILVQGGVNFEPYKKKLFESIGRNVSVVETYPASEGFIAYQDNYKEQGLLLNVHCGMFYEFIEASTYFDEQPKRINLKDVELGVNYALILSTNAGLWAYSIGDTIKFISKNPYKILVTGRIKHFISAFGEHVIGEEVETAMKTALSHFPEAKLIEFTVAPQVAPMEGGLPYHEWFISFDVPPSDKAKFNELLDDALRQKNTYYDDLIKGNVLKKLNLRMLPKEAFIEYMKSEGKLGGQNKVSRLSNDRKIADWFMNRYPEI